MGGEKTGPVSVRAEAKEQAYDNESKNNAGKSEARNVASTLNSPKLVADFLTVTKG